MMRQNLRLENRPLYFRYAPPRITRNDYSNDVNNVLPFPRAKPWECSVYFYWWLFLKEHNGYRKCCLTGGEGKYAPLYQDFGDVHEHSFPVWWRNIGRALFGESQSPMNDWPSCASEERFTASFKTEGNWENPITNSGRSRHSAEFKSQAKYSIVGRPSPKILYRRYKLVTLIRSRPDTPLWKLLDMSEGHYSSRIQSLAEREQKRMIARRYLQEAECIIEYAGRGMFPIRCPSQAR